MFKRCIGLLLAIAPAAAIASGSYHVSATRVLGGDGRWDYLTYDGSVNRVFISRSTHVMVVDGATGAVTGDIPSTPGVHGIALADDLNKGYTSNGSDATVTVFDLHSLRTIATIPLQVKNPDGIVYEPVTKRVFTFDGGSNDAAVIDARTDTVVATIPLGGKPEFPAADGRGMVYDNIESTNEIVAIDAAKATVVKRFALPGCDGPSGLSMDREHRRLFAACQGKMAVVDADNGNVVALIPTGAGTDATRFDPRTGNAFAPNGRDATLSVIHEDDPNHFTLVQNVATAPGARTMALDPATGIAYLVTAKMTENPSATSYRDRYHMVPGTFELLEVSP